eukprot:Gb_35118 [translate_table: standard]
MRTQGSSKCNHPLPSAFMCSFIAEGLPGSTAKCVACPFRPSQLGVSILVLGFQHFKDSFNPFKGLVPLSVGASTLTFGMEIDLLSLWWQLQLSRVAMLLLVLILGLGHGIHYTVLSSISFGVVALLWSPFSVSVRLELL